VSIVFLTTQRAAALAAAAAHAPVVKPVRSPLRFRGGTLLSAMIQPSSQDCALRSGLLKNASMWMFSFCMPAAMSLSRMG
jgi:hypothetical protein